MEQVALQHDAEGLLAGFNDVLGQHMERLLGFRLGPAGMPLNVVTLACLALLSKREHDAKGSVGEPRYTSKGLLKELLDLGLREYGECEDIVRQLMDKDYVRPADEGSIMPNPVALRLEELLERIFPKMPGLNFVAYVTQTMGEVKSGRKELALALSQFEQTLTMQGVSVVKRKPTTPSGERPPLPQKDPHFPFSSPQTSLSFRPRQEQDITGQKEPLPFKRPGPRVLGSTTPSIQLEVHEFTMGEIGLDSDGKAETPLVLSSEPAPNEPEAAKQPNLAEPAVSIESGAETEIAEGSSSKDSAASKPNDKAPQSVVRFEAENQGDPFPRQDPAPIESDEKGMERQILPFEEAIPLWCPICNKNRVEASTTSTGKTYYKCADRDCHFVSWGRPVHHPCPSCQNPFLVQVSDKSGTIAYKCPRATCRFYCLVGEGRPFAHDTGVALRRVVKRRVVRKKN